jgi:N-acetylmuramoyl-L-alanine amidase
MNAKLVALLIVTGGVAGAQAGRGDLVQVRALRHWTSAEASRVAVEISGDFKYRQDRLHNPERIFFDILKSRPHLESRENLNRDLGDPILKRIRVAETQPGITRVVLDLAAEAQASVSQLSNPARLVIELRALKKGEAATPTPKVSSSQAPKPPEATPSKAMPARTPAAPAPVRKPPETESSAAAKGPAAEAVKPPATASRESGPAETAKPAENARPGLAARRTSSGNASLTRALGLKVGRIVIDAGHGGNDQGTAGAKGLLEKELVLDVALRVGKLIETHLGAEVLFTRDSDIYVPLETRTAFANEKKADLFLSIHGNSSPIARISGSETFYLNFTDSRDALDVASRENAASQKSVFELRDLIHKISLHEKTEESREFAGRVQSSLYSFTSRAFPGSRNRGVKKAPFVVLIGANMPSVLAEIGFISNPREEALLKKPDYRDKLAEALYRGIAKYAEGLSHFQVAASGDAKAETTSDSK